MADDPDHMQGGKPSSDERKARVAAALRANLRRRKAAVRKSAPDKPPAK